MFCQARILATLHTIPNTKLTYHTTAECGESASKKIPVDSGEAFMPICGGCFKRFMTKMSVTNNWYGWFDDSYPPNAKVRGSAWYNEQMALAHEITTSTIDMDEVAEKLNSLYISEASSPGQAFIEPEAEAEAEPEADEVEAEPEADEVEAELEPEPPTKEEQKQALKAQIKELQKNAKPGKMSLKEIQAAFKEITNLKTKIHML